MERLTLRFLDFSVMESKNSLAPPIIILYLIPQVKSEFCKKSVLIGVR